MEYFKLVDGIVTLDHDMIGVNSNIKKILSRDRGGKVSGDPDGRLKLYAFKEFAYVYYRCDYRAYPSQSGMSEKEAHIYAATQAGLGKEYKPDELVSLLMTQYEREHLSESKKAIKTLIRIFAFNNKLVEKIEAVLTTSLDLPTLTPQQTGELLAFQKQLMDIATKVPENVKQLKVAMNLLEEEEKAKEIGRGGDEITDSYKPDNNIEN
jgi:hypothetical protein